MTVERKEIITLGLEDIEIWPDWCVRNDKNCKQCHLEGKIACHPRFRRGLKPVAEIAVESLLKEGKTPLEIHKTTGIPLPTIYSKGQRLRNKGELQRLVKPHPEEQNSQIIIYVKEHPEEMYRDIAKLFKVEPSYISRLCSKAGIHRRELIEKEKTEKVDMALKMLESEPTRSITSIAEELGMTPTTLGYKIRGRGILPLHHTARLVLETIRVEVIKAVNEALSQNRRELVNGDGMHCPRCGDNLTIFEENMGYRWLYRMYPCQRCKIIWGWSSRIRDGDNYWKLEECRAWEAVGIPILEEAK